jgi:hypothetical protein
VMDLSEQLAEYERKWPSVDITAPPGTRIVFHGNGGYPAEREAALSLLKVGETYTLAGSSIGNWQSTFFLEGYKGGFNSCLFSPEGWTPAE